MYNSPSLSRKINNDKRRKVYRVPFKDQKQTEFTKKRIL